MLPVNPELAKRCVSLLILVLLLIVDDSRCMFLFRWLRDLCLRAATSDNSLEDHPNSRRSSVDLYYVEESLEEEGIWIRRWPPKFLEGAFAKR